MNLINFTETYPDESSCKAAFKSYRDKEGVICPRCDNKEHYWKKDKEMYECKKCRTRQSLRSHTVMHGSQLPFRYWFIAMHLLTPTKKSFSALELQHQLGHKYYEPIWAMLHKLREAMGARDDLYQLAGSMELDDGFFSTDKKEKDKDEPLKRGRGSQKKSTVLVMVESEETGNKKTKNGKSRKVDHLKMKVVEDLKSDTVTLEVEQNISAGSKIDSDDSTSYVKLSEVVEVHNPQVIAKEDTNKILPWVHIAISNAKRLFLDVFHHMSPKYLQNYLNEYCYKFNRRYFGEKRFDRLLVACVSHQNTFRYKVR